MTRHDVVPQTKAMVWLRDPVDNRGIRNLPHSVTALGGVKVETTTTFGPGDSPPVADRQDPPDPCRFSGHLRRQPNPRQLTMGYGIAVGHNAVAMLMQRAGIAGFPAIGAAGDW